MQKHDHPIERAQELTTCSSAIHRFPRRQACRNIQVTEHHIKRLMLHWCTYVRMPIYVYTHYVSIHYLRYGSIYCVCSDNSSTFGAMPSTLGVNCTESSSNVPKCYLLSSSSYLFRVWLAVGCCASPVLPCIPE